MNPPKLPNSFRHKFRYPSIQKETPQFLPLYNLIQSQNHDEEDFLERNFNPKDPILNNLPKQAPPFKMRAQIGKGKLFSFKRRNLHLEGNFTNRTFEEKSDEDDNNSIIKRKNTSFCEIMKKINKDLSKSLLYDQEFSQKRFLRRSNISVLFDKQRHDSDIQIKKLLSELFQDQKGPLKFHDEIKDRFEKIRNRREIEKSFSLLSQKPNIRSYELMELLYNRRLLCSACSQSEKGDFNELGSKNISSVQRDNNDSIKVSEDKSPSSVLQTENKSPTSILKSRNGNNYPIIESFSKSESNNKDPSSILHSNNKSPFSIKSSQNKTSYLEETSYLTQDFPFKKSLKPEIWDYFFTMRMQRVDSQKIRLFLKIEGKEVAFVMGEGSDNYLRFNRKKEEFQFYGNDQHDKGLLLDIERKLLEDLRLQNSKNQTFFQEIMHSNSNHKKSGLKKSKNKKVEYNLQNNTLLNSQTIKNQTPTTEKMLILLQKDNNNKEPNFIDSPLKKEALLTPSFLSSKEVLFPEEEQEEFCAFEIFLNMKKKEPVVKNPCIRCQGFYRALKELLHEVYRQDLKADEEVLRVDEAFKKYLEKTEGNENLLLKNIGDSFRGCLKSGLIVLPGHCVFFEKVMKIILFANERIVIKGEASIGMLTAENRSLKNEIEKLKKAR